VHRPWRSYRRWQKPWTKWGRRRIGLSSIEPIQHPRTKRHMSPIELIQKQTEAYNAHHAERFAACYSETAEIYRDPLGPPSLVGRDQIRAFYARERFHLEGLRAEILNRIAVGSIVIEHEKVWGLESEPLECAVVYEVVAGEIHRVWFYR
jgi:hypothetical protein